MVVTITVGYGGGVASGVSKGSSAYIIKLCGVIASDLNIKVDGVSLAADALVFTGLQVSPTIVSVNRIRGGEGLDYANVTGHRHNLKLGSTDLHDGSKLG